MKFPPIGFWNLCIHNNFAARRRRESVKPVLTNHLIRASDSDRNVLTKGDKQWLFE